MARLILVRHGATDWNRDGRYQGHSDTPLNAEGMAQAQRLVDLLRSDGISQVVSSDLRRASVTAQILAEGLRLAPPRLDPRLREIDLGEWEGRLATEIAEDDARSMGRPEPESSGGWRTGGRDDASGGAARLGQPRRNRHPGAPSDDGAVVSHGVALATALCRVRDMPLERASETRYPTTPLPIGSIGRRIDG